MPHSSFSKLHACTLCIWWCCFMGDVSPAHRPRCALAPAPTAERPRALAAWASLSGPYQSERAADQPSLTPGPAPAPRCLYHADETTERHDTSERFRYSDNPSTDSLGESGWRCAAPSRRGTVSWCQTAWDVASMLRGSDGRPRTVGAMRAAGEAGGPSAGQRSDAHLGVSLVCGCCSAPGQ